MRAALANRLVPLRHVDAKKVPVGLVNHLLYNCVCDVANALRVLKLLDSMICCPFERYINRNSSCWLLFAHEVANLDD
jgi:hypothetical protein